MNAYNKDHATPLFLAAQQGHVEIVRFLDERGASLDETIHDGATPIHVAASDGHLDVIEFLVSRGASFHTKKTVMHTTPFYAAAQNGHEDVVTFFLRNSYDVNEQNCLSGLSALHIATIMGRLGVIKVLLNHPTIDKDALANFATSRENDLGERVPVNFAPTIGGITLDPKNDNGYTPLHFACIWGQEAVVKELITGGADLSVRTLKEGKTALDLAQERGNNTIVTLLQSAQTRCAFCYKIEKTRACGRCKESFYCDENCQRKHWATHKATCIKK